MGNTQENVEAAFAGESQANRRYLFFAEEADKAGDKQVARLFRRQRQLPRFPEYFPCSYLLLVGAANKTESLTGWFVKDGVDDLPIEPILGLYKNQVRQLAGFLDIPAEIINEPPSPDMFRGLTDEFVLGFSYEKIDRVLYVLEHELGETTAFAEGITPGEFNGIKKLNQLSAWKRASKHDYPVFE